MKTDLPASNPLAEEYNHIKINLIKLLPHLNYIEEFISKEFFFWKETYLENCIKYLKNITEIKSNEGAFGYDREKSLKLVENQLNLLESQLSKVKKHTIKTSVLVTDHNAVFVNYNSLKTANYNKQNNTLTLKTQEEDKLNLGYFKEEVQKRFKTAENLINNFFKNNKISNVNSLKLCLIKLSEFNIEKEKELIDIVYENEPTIKYESLDIHHFTDVVNSNWKRLDNLISENLSLLNSLYDKEPADKLNVEINEYLGKNSKKLSCNQKILLLEEVDFFHLEKIKNLTKTKQAKLISILINLNDKNIKTSIEKLDKKPHELKDSYAKDISIVKLLMNNF